MKAFLTVAALAATIATVHAQTGLVQAPSQTTGGINPTAFAANTQPSGFGENALAFIAAAGTTQTTATLIKARTVVLTACAAGAGVTLPSITRYTPVVIINRSGASCLVYPSPNAALETAAGTFGAVNAAATVASNTDTTWRPVSPTSWVQ